ECPVDPPAGDGRGARPNRHLTLEAARVGVHDRVRRRAPATTGRRGGRRGGRARRRRRRGGGARRLAPTGRWHQVGLQDVVLLLIDGVPVVQGDTTGVAGVRVPGPVGEGHPVRGQVLHERVEPL